MRDYLIEEIEYRGFSIKMYQDEYAWDPRESDNLGHMVCFHRNYNLGDSNHSFTPDSLKEYLEDEDNFIQAFPLYLYDHSGFRMNISGHFRGGYHDRFDSGLVGYIYTTKEKCELIGIDPENMEQIEKILRAEVDVYDDYIAGNVFLSLIEDKNGKTIDSCGSWFGSEGYKQAIAEAEITIDNYYRGKVNKHINKLKGYIKAHVPLIYRKPFAI